MNYFTIAPQLLPDDVVAGQKRQAELVSVLRIELDLGTLGEQTSPGDEPWLAIDHNAHLD